MQLIEKRTKTIILMHLVIAQYPCYKDTNVSSPNCEMQMVLEPQDEEIKWHEVHIVIYFLFIFDSRNILLSRDKTVDS